MVKEAKNKDAKKEKNKTIKKKKDTKKEKKVAKKGIIEYIKSVFKEVSKVKWPSKKDMIKYSVATIVFIIFFSLFFYAIELLMALIESLV